MFCRRIPSLPFVVPRSWAFCVRNYLLVPLAQLFESTPSGDIGINGHIKAVRHLKLVSFIDVSDGTCGRNLAVVVPRGNQSADLMSFEGSVDSLVDDLTEGLRVGQLVRVVGRVKPSRGKQQFELVCETDNNSHRLDVIGGVESDYPMQKKAVSFPFLRQHLSLRHRTTTLASIIRTRSVVESAVGEFFTSTGFFKVTPPILTTSDCEGAGEQFAVAGGTEFFGRPTFLTVSTQLHLEVLCQSLRQVWTLSPVFRAENSHTNRHLSEFWMLEAEMAYVDDIDPVMDVVENMVRHVVNGVRGYGDDILASRYRDADKKTIRDRWDVLSHGNKWPRITYRQAIALINDKSRPQPQLQFGDDILTVQEKWLAHYFNQPVFVTDYPRDQKPFYMAPSPTETECVACFDLLIPEMGEIIGGSLREHNHDLVVREMHRRGMDPKDMEWYLVTRRNGTVPHGGFGLGFDRLLAYITGIDNVRDIVPFPRAPDVCVT